MLVGLVLLAAAGLFVWIHQARHAANLNRRRYFVYSEGRPVGPLTREELLAMTSPDSFIKLGDIWVGRAEHPDFGR